MCGVVCLQGVRNDEAFVPFGHRRRAVLDLTEKPNLSLPAILRDGYRVLPLRDIERHKGFAILSHGPPSVREARLGLPEQPSFSIARRGRTTGFTPGT